MDEDIRLELPERQPPCCGDETCCRSVAYQYADVCVPVQICPDIKVGKPEVECCGTPVAMCADCEHDKENRCELVITQKLCIKIPLCCCVKAVAGESEIDCCSEEPCG